MLPSFQLKGYPLSHVKLFDLKISFILYTKSHHVCYTKKYTIDDLNIKIPPTIIYLFIFKCNIQPIINTQIIIKKLINVKIKHLIKNGCTHELTEIHVTVFLEGAF